MTIEFTVPGRPVPMARPRVTTHGTYTPAKCREYKQYVAMMARQAMRHHEPMTGAVHIILQFTFQTPKSWSKVKKACADIVGHTSRPDWDNLAKSVTDAMIGIVYKDDSQIETATVDKRYGESDEVRIVVDEQKDWREYIKGGRTMINSYRTGRQNGKRILEATLLLNSFCMEQHWRCGECPFYKHDGGNCLLYGFPHMWNPAEWEEMPKCEVVSDAT